MALAEFTFFACVYAYDVSFTHRLIFSVLDEVGKGLLFFFLGGLFAWVMSDGGEIQRRRKVAVGITKAFDTSTMASPMSRMSRGRSGWGSPMKRSFGRAFTMTNMKVDKATQGMGQWQLVFRQQRGFAWPPGMLDWCKFDPCADNFARLADVEKFRDPATGHFSFYMCWPGSSRAPVAWSQKTLPTSTSPRAPDYEVDTRHLAGPTGQAAPLARAEADALLVRV